MTTASPWGAALMAALACCATSGAQESDAAAPPPITVIHAGRVLVDAASPPQTERSVIVRDGRVAEVRAGYAQAADFPDAEVTLIDLSDAFVSPGLIDLHTHLTLVHGPDRPDRARVTQGRLALYGAAHAEATLQAGFTSVRNVGAASAAIFALREAIADGDVDGPRIFASGHSISVTSGHGDIEGYPEAVGAVLRPTGVCDGPNDCRRATRAQIRRGADWIKINASGGGGEDNGGPDNPPEMDADEMAAVVATAHALGRRVAAHAHGTASVNAALAAGVDTIEHGGFSDAESIRLYLETGACLVPTLSVLDQLRDAVEEGAVPPFAIARMTAFLNRMPDALRRAHEAGVCIALGTDAGVVPHGNNARELEWLVDIGMSEAEALAAATRAAADVLEKGDELGQLDAGYHADIIAVAGDPLADISAMREVGFVMKAGRVIKNDFAP